MGGTSEYDPAPNSERTRSNCMGLPPGFRFYPTDQEILSHYLFPKIVDCRFTARAMGEVDLNRSEPWELPGKAKMGETDFLYFFCQRDRKYPTGMRTNRATGAGYWKATGKDKDINEERNNTLVGMKKTLVFYMGRAPKGVKTNWVMHEYRLEGKASYWKLPRSSPKDWVVCRVFHKSTGIKRDLTAQESLQTAESSHGYDSNRNAVVPMLLQSLMESPHYLNTSTDGLHLDCGLANYTPDKLDMSQDVAILKNNPPLINTYSMYPSHRILFPSQQAPPVPNPPLPAPPTLNGNQCSSTGERCYAAIGDETAFGAIGDETAFRAIGDETAFQQGIRTKCKMEEQYPEQSHIRMVLRDHTVTGDPRSMWTFQNN